MRTDHPGTTSRTRPMTATHPTTAAARRSSLASGALLLALALAACGSGGTDDAGGPDGAAPLAVEDVDSTHGEADIAFAQGMVPHHEQAVEMAELALEQAEDPEVVALAEQVAAAQEPEIESLGAMLEAWGVGASGDPGDDGMAGMDMGDGSSGDGSEGMPGMMSAEDMRALAGAEGAAFDRAWLEMMLEHHEGAVEMATVEVEDGENPQAVDLAERIVESQQAEIAQMQDLLDG